MTLEGFLAAHIQNGSLKDGRRVPPFYHPVEKISGPEIVFVLHFDGCGYCPVFIQLKMRISMDKAQTRAAQTTVDSDAVQRHLENDLQAFCTLTPKRFLGVVITYPAELTSFQDSFDSYRQSERLRAAQGEQTLECVTLRIDKDNIHSLFPAHHMEALDRLKGIKRELNQDSDDLVDEQVAKHRGLIHF
ncbi:hypothetical protein BC939DRAFT_472873 [Gamsiella multidivaricata]|uniref:uncharacterized protein n=1 Tax=Gamsiella multidivaricata TaxID=101098 RepID=UPI0022207E3D|nr:uncharacterized protein BC939DRAFT_472873 [Gamsiella multidivaricata]KAI7831777.1 hypothetical protein BC939DRAFT_472873 [Gamsiella multidivaricata]